MAQGPVAAAPAPSNGNGALTAEDLREILEYDKIVRFRDEIFAGTHPRIKLPAHILKQVNSSRVMSSSGTSTPTSNIPAQAAYSTPTVRNEEPPSFYNKSPNNQRSGVGASMNMSSKSEINPILLEKSDDLIKAEIQLQRQRLERGLREQIEKQRIEAKALLQSSESLPNFDLSEVLSKALEIVHPSTVNVAEPEPSDGARSLGSDSFDDNTFYSSQHDSPIPSVSPQTSDHVAAQSSSAKSSGDHTMGIQSAQSLVEDQDVVMAGTSLPSNMSTARGLPPKPPAQITTANSQHLRVQTSGSNSSSPREVVASNGVLSSGRILNNDAPRQVTNPVVPSPVMRAHNLSPLAPQPSRVSPLATAREPPILRESAAIEEVQAPQVTALRTQVGGLSSTDSSPKTSRGADKKKEKKKKGKRKAKDSLDTPDSPYIKPEPRSPSPYGVAPLPRPQKRQRQSGQYAAELNYDEPSGRIQSGSVRDNEHYAEAPIRREYRAVEERYEPGIRRPEPAYRRVERYDENYQRIEPVEGDYRPARYEGVEYARGPHSAAAYAVPYAQGDVRSVRAVSQAIPDRRVIEEPRYYREPAMRASDRPEAIRERSRSPAMRPPPQPMRKVIDEYGNAYYEMIPAAPMRQSVAPVARYRETEPIYERAPMRAVSSRIPLDTYEEDGILYRRSSPSMAAPRRVVIQPEYATPSQPEYREYRPREASVRPSVMGPPIGEPYVQARGVVERREMSHFDEVPREPIRRATSVYPDAVRYEQPREYGGRMQSVRPIDAPVQYVSSSHPGEVPSRQYAASVRPEARREMAPPQSYREFSIRPEGAPMPRREPVVGLDGAGYHEEAPIRGPAGIAYTERSRAREASVVVYGEDVRREVYR